MLPVATLLNGLGVAVSSRFSRLSRNLDIKIIFFKLLILQQKKMSVDFTGPSDHQSVTPQKSFVSHYVPHSSLTSYKIRFSSKPAPPTLGSFGWFWLRCLTSRGGVCRLPVISEITFNFTHSITIYRVAHSTGETMVNRTDMVCAFRTQSVPRGLHHRHLITLINIR